MRAQLKVFSCEIYEIFLNFLFTEPLWGTLLTYRFASNVLKQTFSEISQNFRVQNKYVLRDFYSVQVLQMLELTIQK